MKPQVAEAVNYTVSLLHCNGDDSGTVFTDESGKVWTASNAYVHTHQAVKKFGNASVFCDYRWNDYIKCENHADHDFGTGDFTIDWWEYPTAETHLYMSRDGGESGTYSGLMINTAQGLYMSENGSDWNTATNRTLGSITQNVWTHYAIVRDGITFYTFKGGVQQDTWESDKRLYPGQSGFMVGARGIWAYYTGYFDEFRISKGISRWTADFSASLPSAEYPYPDE
jgi:hypothetical protein